ncbi:hypothetical protein ACLOJK_020537 [Asimina triloba]
MNEACSDRVSLSVALNHNVWQLGGKAKKKFGGKAKNKSGGKTKKMESQLSPSQSHSSSSRGPPNPTTPIASLTNVSKTTRTTCSVICEEAKMNDTNPLPTEEEDTCNAETEFWEWVFLGSGTQRIAKIIPVDIDLDKVSKSNEHHLRAEEEAAELPVTHTQMTVSTDSRGLTRLSFSDWLATDVKKE